MPQIHALGPDRPETIDSMRELGFLYMETDQWQEAKATCATVLQKTLSPPGKSIQAVLNARANHAATLARSG